MSDSHRPDDVAVHNERSLKKLAWAIEASVGQFKLFLARCNYTSLRSQLVERLRELTGIDIRVLELKASEKTLFAKIHTEFESEQPDALMVFGLESVSGLDELLTGTNQVREEFRKHFHFPLVLWVNDEVLTKLMQLAPDFESWATTTEFLITTDELLDFLKKTAEQFFEGNLTLTLEACQEIKRACHELQGRELGLDLELKAIVEFLLGFTEYGNPVSQNLDQALEHYQKALELWQQSYNLDRKAIALYYITLCYYLKAVQYSEIEHSDWKETRRYLQQCLDVFEEAKRPDLVANSILNFGRILRWLRNWEELKTLAKKALRWHEAENKPIELAQDYGFLAEVALAKKLWTEAKELAQKALEVLSAVPSLQSANNSGAVYKLPDKSVISYAPSRYRFILGQAQQYLGQHQEAIRNLEAAREVGSPEHDTQLYLDILCHLQKFYEEEQKEYLKAFEIKQERQSIEQQYGFRAFVGARWIQPQRQAKFALTQVDSQETVAPEIAASVRQLDVEELIQRIGHNGYKLIVIHGQSGVGKSSLVSGGLVPALKQKAFGTSVQDAFPVSMRVYTNWVGDLGRLLAEALEQKGIQLTTPLDSIAAILEQLKQNEKQRNLRTVLIFDQFEEFFFAYPHPGERRQFFEFLGDCLKILSLKALLSLREDYLHYLLECNRLPSMAIISNDILSKNVLYPLGNFSPVDATSIIQRLMERSNFQLEPTLIEVLVQDLAGELGEVRPIELQIVGAQLQTEKIKTLSEYREHGQKDELVKRYLNEVVRNCGFENQKAAELVLYLLTDEKGTRPLRTRAEVEQDLQELAEGSMTEASRLDLVFKIFVDSGLVVLLPENPDARYQLVHDYLAAFIRQQQEPKLKELMAELEKERKQRQRAEKQSKLVEKRLERSEQDKHTLETELQQVKQDLEAAKAELNSINQEVQAARTNLIKAEAERKEAIAATELELEGLKALQQFQSSQINALVAAMRAGHKLKLLIQDGGSCGKYSTLSPLLALQQILNNIREKNRFQGHRDEVKSVSFSPDGQCLATASSDGTARVWDLQGNQLLKLRRLESKVNSVSFSPDGQYLATASSDGAARMWNLQGNQRLRLRLQSKVNSVSFSPDGQYLATASNDSTARVWDLQGNQLVEFNGHQGHVNSESFSPDGQYLATASDDGTARVWDLQGNQLMECKGHHGKVRSVNFSPDGQYLVTASDDGTARVWDLQGNQLMECKGHHGKVRSVNFSPDGQYLATASDDGTARVWDLQGNQLMEFQGNESWVWSVSFSPNGHYLATALSDSTVRLWDLQHNQPVEFKKHQEDINSVSFSSDEDSLATTSDEATTELLRVEDLDQLLARGCEWLRDYLTTNQNVRESDRHLCDNIKIQE